MQTLDEYNQERRRISREIYLKVLKESKMRPMFLNGHTKAEVLCPACRKEMVYAALHVNVIDGDPSGMPVDCPRCGFYDRKLL